MTKSRSSQGARVMLVTGLALGATVGLAAAHDFWIVPTGFEIASGGSVEVRGQTGLRFPTTVSAVTPDRVADARLLSSGAEERIADLSVSGKSLLLRHRPSTPGERVVAVALVTRTSRASPAGLKRYIGLEGAPELAERYDREGAFSGTDSVTQQTTKFAKTIVEVGRGGPRAFARTAGHALEFVPLADPMALHPGDTLPVRLLFRGQPLARAHFYAGAAPEAALDDSTALPPRSQDPSFETDANGVARVPLDRPGLWNFRTLHAAPVPGKSGEWEVAFATIVFRVVTPNGSGGVNGSGVAAQSDSATVATTVQGFHAALATGDSTAALALLAPDVTILESGGVESRDDYRAHHLPGDIAFAQAVSSQRGPTAVKIHGNVAWAVTTSTTQGTYRDRPVNSTGAELMVLSREPDGWKIRAIHWSSRTRRP